MPTNDFLPFCPTDTGTNLLDEADYTASAGRTSGNQPGIASAKLNNKALRQATYVTSQMAQFLSNQLNNDVLDDATPAKLLAQFLAVLKPYAPNVTQPAVGSGTWYPNYIFFIVSGNATANATYTNNSKTFTVVSTVSGATEIRMTGTGNPTVSGTLTKASGTGDATLTFYAFRMPVSVIVEMVGAGGGGGGAGGSPTDGTNGTGTVYGTGTAGGGTSGKTAGTGGTPGGNTPITGPTQISVNGTAGAPAGANVSGGSGGNGGPSAFGGAGLAGFGTGSTTTNAAANSGSGGGGAAISGGSGAGGGSSGGYIKATLTSGFTGGIGYTVGAKGTGGTGTHSGGDGGDGSLTITECYQ